MKEKKVVLISLGVCLLCLALVSIQPAAPTVPDFKTTEVKMVFGPGAKPSDLLSDTTDACVLVEADV